MAVSGLSLDPQTFLPIPYASPFSVHDCLPLGAEIMRLSARANAPSTNLSLLVFGEAVFQTTGGGLTKSSSQSGAGGGGRSKIETPPRH